MVAPPVPIPPCGISTSDHGARNIARLRRRAKCGGAIAASAAGGPASHCWTIDQDMAGRAHARLFSNQADELVAGGARICDRARMTWAARSVHFPRCDARQANVWTFRTPDRAVTVIDGRGRAVERLASGDDRDGEQEREYHSMPLAWSIDLRSPSGVTHHKAASLSISSDVGSASSFNSSIRAREIPVLRVIVSHGVHICPSHASIQ